jgi:hypothetical protein
VPSRDPADDVTRLAVLGAVARRGLPHILEATVVPAVLFYLALEVLGLGAAFVVALAWSFGAIGRRLATRRAVPPLLVLASLGLTIRTIAAVASNSSFVYFIQPVLGTAAMGLVFVGSVVVGRPLIARLAHDFCPLTQDVVIRPGVVGLFRRLTLLWAFVNFATAATNFAMLQSMSVSSFVAAKTLAGWAITVSAVALTVTDAVRTARREGLLEGGRGHALVAAMAAPTAR